MRSGDYDSLDPSLRAPPSPTHDYVGLTDVQRPTTPLSESPTEHLDQFGYLEVIDDPEISS